MPQRPQMESAPNTFAPSDADGAEPAVELLPPTPDADELVPIPQLPTGPAIIPPGGPAEAAAPLNLVLEVTAPSQKQVESNLVYRIVVRNLGERPAENVVVDAT